MISVGAAYDSRTSSSPSRTALQYLHIFANITNVLEQILELQRKYHTQIHGNQNLNFSTVVFVSRVRTTEAAHKIYMRACCSFSVIYNMADVRRDLESEFRAHPQSIFVTKSKQVLPSLQSKYLDKCKEIEISGCISPLIFSISEICCNLTSIHVSSVVVKLDDDVFMFTPNLRYLVLIDCQLQCLPESVCCLNHLELLSVYHNQITELPEDLFFDCICCRQNRRYLYKLYLDGNAIDGFPLGVYHMGTVEKLLYDRRDDIVHYARSPGTWSTEYTGTTRMLTCIPTLLSCAMNAIEAKHQLSETVTCAFMQNLDVKTDDIIQTLSRLDLLPSFFNGPRYLCHRHRGAIRARNCPVCSRTFFHKPEDIILPLSTSGVPDDMPVILRCCSMECVDIACFDSLFIDHLEEYAVMANCG